MRENIIFLWMIFSICSIQNRCESSTSSWHIPDSIGIYEKAWFPERNSHAVKRTSGAPFSHFLWDKWTGGRIVERTDGNERSGGRAVGWTDCRTDGRSDGWTGSLSKIGRTDRRTDEWTKGRAIACCLQVNYMLWRAMTLHISYMLLCVPYLRVHYVSVTC